MEGYEPITDEQKDGCYVFLTNGKDFPTVPFYWSGWHEGWVCNPTGQEIIPWDTENVDEPTHFKYWLG